MLCITYCPISFAQIIPTHTNFSLATVLLSLAKLEKDLGNRISSVQSLSQVRLFATPWTAAHQASVSITKSRSLLKLIHRIGDAIQPSHPLLSPSPPVLSLSQHQGLFQWVSFSHQVAKVLEFQLHRQSFQWIFRTDFLSDLVWSEYIFWIFQDWLDLLAVQGTLKSLLQHHSSKASILRRSAFFIVQLSHLYMTIGKL